MYVKTVACWLLSVFLRILALWI